MADAITSSMQIRSALPRNTSVALTASSSHSWRAAAISGSSFVAQSETR
jgi:hypothetical protein